MGFFDLFKMKKNDSTQSGKPALKFKSTSEAMKKHIIMYMLLDPETCFYQCKDLKKKDAVEFFYKDKKLYTMGNPNICSAYAFAWLIKEVWKNQDAFARFFEILDRSYIESYAETIAMDGNMLCNEIKHYFSNFELGNSQEEIKSVLEWTYIDIQALHKFFLEAEDFLRINLMKAHSNLNKDVANCTNISELLQALLAWNKQ